MEKHSEVKICLDDNEWLRLVRKPLYKDDDDILDACGEITAYEVKLQKSKVVDDKPLHTNVAILQYSKLLFLHFMYFIKNHLIKGSFRSCYADTGKILIHSFTHSFIQTLWLLHSQTRNL